VAAVIAIVMPANAGIHVFLNRTAEKSWMPAFAGMTGNGTRMELWQFHVLALPI
jgi:hypothetical protein